MKRPLMLLLVCALLVLGNGVAAANAQQGEPDQLWQEFPLEPTPTEGAAATATATATPTAREPQPQPTATPTAEEDGSDRWAFAALLAGAAGLGACPPTPPGGGVGAPDGSRR